MARPKEGSKLGGALIGIGLLSAIWAGIAVAAWLLRDDPAATPNDGGAEDALAASHRDAGASEPDASVLDAFATPDADTDTDTETDTDSSVSLTDANATLTDGAGDAAPSAVDAAADASADRGTTVAYEVCAGDVARIAAGSVGRGSPASIVIACRDAAYVVELAAGQPRLLAILDAPDPETEMMAFETHPVIADVTGDALGDIVVGGTRMTARGAPRLGGAWVVPGVRGAGRVGTRSIALGSASVTSLAAAELDGHAGVEVLVGHMGNWFANETNEVRVYRGGARPTRTSTIRTDGTETVSVAAADLTRDGQVDLVVAHEARGGLTVFTGDGHGGFGDARSFSDVLGTGASVVDLDGDRLPEVLLESESGPFRVLDGNPGEIAPPRDVGFAHERVYVPTDIDADHVTDLVVAIGTNTFFGPDWWDISVQRGHGDGTFEVRELVRSGFHPIDLAIADLDGDGALDLAWLGVSRVLGQPDQNRVVLQIATRITMRAQGDPPREGPLDMVPLPRPMTVPTVALH